MPPQLKSIVLGGDFGPRVLIVGGVHGDEYEPMLACRQLASELEHLPIRGRVTLIPCVNEPAFARGTRTADDGIDLARVCPGRADGGMTEQIAFALSEHIHDADYFIDLHTGGVQYRLLPLAGYILHRDAKILATQRRMAQAFNLPVVWGTSPELNGRSLSVARDAGVPAIYAEYEGGAQCSPAGVNAYVEGCLNVLRELDLIDRGLPASQVRYTVEDDQPGAGFLQLWHPSPSTGLFQPAVGLEQRVTKGDVLGYIIDVTTGAMDSIHAVMDGIVLMLPALPRVRKGDATVALLNTAN